MTTVLVACFMFAVAGLAGWYAYLSHVSANRLSEAQLLFIGKLDARDVMAREERAEVAASYERFIDHQAASEQVLEEVDKAWMNTDDSRVDPDPDLDWESER